MMIVTCQFFGRLWCVINYCGESFFFELPRCEIDGTIERRHTSLSRFSRHVSSLYCWAVGSDIEFRAWQ